MNYRSFRACVVIGISLFLAVVQTDSVSAQGAEPLEAEVVVDAGHDVRTIPRTLYGTNIEWARNGNGKWLPVQNRFNADILHLAKELDVALMRFPGGMFADFYHWKNAIGPRQNRKKTQALEGEGDFQAHDFGTDEALEFAKRCSARLLVTVNIVTGTPQEAAEWVEYVNKTKAGPDPALKTDYWEIGNENYSKGKAGIPPDEYARRFLEFARAMRKADPSIKLMAIGCENFNPDLDRNHQYTYANWTQTVLEKAGREMDLLAVHNAYAPFVYDAQSKSKDVRSVYRAMLAAPMLIKKNLQQISRQVETSAADRAGRIKLAVTEWAPFFSFFPSDRYTDHVKTLGSALYTASVMKVFLETPRMEVANYFMLSDFLFNATIMPREGTPLQAWLDGKEGLFIPTASYYVLQLYTRHFGQILVDSSTTSPKFDAPAVGFVPETTDVPYLDVVCSRAADGETLYLLAINKHFDEPIRTTINLKGFKPRPVGRVFTLDGTGIDAHTGTAPIVVPGAEWAQPAEDEQNPRFNRGGPDEVKLTATEVKDIKSAFTYTFAAHSVTVIEMTSAE